MRKREKRRYGRQSGNPCFDPRCTRGSWGVQQGGGLSGWKGVRGTPWLGSRRGVVITSRSDRVPLLSRRHTPAEKQNGTSDRPTLPTDHPLTSPCHFILSTSHDFDLDELFSPLVDSLSKLARFPLSTMGGQRRRGVNAKSRKVYQLRKSHQGRKKWSEKREKAERKTR